MHKLVFAAVLCGIFVAPLRAETPELERRVFEHTCPNGIKLLVVERHFSPTVAIRMMFRTGSVDETSGKTGLAHMFEHMMFKGTRTLGTKDYAKEAPLLKRIDALHQELDTELSKGTQADQSRVNSLRQKIQALDAQEDQLITANELWNLYEREGASELNAGTSRDYTQYVVDLPSNKVELWAILDSARVKDPVFRQFYQERQVVKEERRMRVDTNPEGKLYENFIAAAYIANPYHHPTLGWVSDLDQLNVRDLDEFYRGHYTPERLTIVLVGDVQTSKVVALVDRYFGNWRPQNAAPPSPITSEPPQEGIRRVSVRYEAQPHLLMGFHIPSYPDPAHFDTFAVSQILSSGTTSRLYKALVERQKLAISVETASDEPGERYPPLFVISATPRYPHTLDEVEHAIWTEIDRLKKGPIEPWEMEKLRAEVSVSLLNTLQSNDGLADNLAYDQSIFGDWHYVLTFQKRIETMTPAEVQAAAQKYLTEPNATVAVLQGSKPHPNAPAAGASAPAASSGLPPKGEH